MATLPVTAKSRTPDNVHKLYFQLLGAKEPSAAS